MIINEWVTHDWIWANVVVSLLFVYVLIYVAVAKKFKLINTMSSLLVLGLLVNLSIYYLSPTERHIYYKYESTNEVAELCKDNWKLVNHYTNKRIAYLKNPL